MSGHLLIPFSTFFGATAIGKGIIKVHIQVRNTLLIHSFGYSRRSVSLYARR